MNHEPRSYRQGRASANGGRGQFATISKAERVEHYHRSIVLARIFANTDKRWVLKGGTALVWRDPGARATRDLDIFNQSAEDIQKAVEEFKEALKEISTAPFDISFECESDPGRITVAGNRQSTSVRVHLLNEFGRRVPNPISIDVVVGCQVTGELEERRAQPLEDALQTKLPLILLYPIVDHLADKVAATMQTYEQLGKENPSTRVKDLVDIVHIALTETIDGAQLHTALESERLERGLTRYTEGLLCPDSWKTLYTNRKVKKGKAPESYDEALSIAKALIDPAIRGEVNGKIWRAGAWY